MKTDDYRDALETACREYEDVSAKRAILDKRLDRLHDTIAALTRLCGLTPTVPWGLTDACRFVLRRADGAMTPLKVRDRLRGIGLDLSRYSNELSAIHTTLNRLIEAGEVTRVTGPTGERAYAAIRVRVVTHDQALAYLPLGLDDVRRAGRRKS